MTGKQLEATIFIGPTYYMRLKHMVKDKINYRATGPLTKLTRQPVSGRANDGGLRIGEMERDAVISHGMSHFLKESMMERADAYKLAICNKTGMVAIYNPSKDLLISPSADGPIQYNGSVEKEGNIEVKQMTKHGRSFSLVHVPYSLKLMMQELQCINVQMHIITDDNINQLENMNFSKNVRFGKDETPQTLIEQIQKNLNKKIEKKSILESSIEEEYKPSNNEFPNARLSPEEIDIAALMARQDEEAGKLPPRAPFDINNLIPKKITPRSPDDPPPDDEDSPYKSPEWATASPAYNPYDDPNYSPSYDPNPTSPPWNPNNSESSPESENSVSPEYHPSNPDYAYYDPKDPATHRRFYDPNDPFTHGPGGDPNDPVMNFYNRAEYDKWRESQQQQQKGGGSIVVGNFQLDDKVFLKGDSNPKRLWNVVHANELDKSYLIDTQNLDGIDVDASKQLVFEKDIRKPDLFDYNANAGPQYNPAAYYSQNMPPPIPPPYQSLYPAQQQDCNPPPVMNVVKIYNQSPAGAEPAAGARGAQTSVEPMGFMEEVTNFETPIPNLPDFKGNNFIIEKLPK